MKALTTLFAAGLIAATTLPANAEQATPALSRAAVAEWQSHAAAFLERHNGQPLRLGDTGITMVYASPPGQVWLFKADTGDFEGFGRIEWTAEGAEIIPDNGYVISIKAGSTLPQVEQREKHPMAVFYDRLIGSVLTTSLGHFPAGTMLNVDYQIVVPDAQIDDPRYFWKPMGDYLFVWSSVDNHRRYLWTDVRDAISPGSEPGLVEQ